MTDMRRAASNNRSHFAKEALARRPRFRAVYAPVLLVAFAACSGSAPSVVGQDQVIALDEDAVSSGRLIAIALGNRVLTYAIAVQAAHGTVTIDAASGAFSYRPTKDYNGSDRFSFVATDGRHSSVPATVTITVNPLNDPPVLPLLPDTGNSPETQETLIALPTHDVDGDLLAYTVTVSNPAVTSAVVDSTGTLVLTPHARGTSTVAVQASDGAYTASHDFQFTVGEVTKQRRFDVPVPREHVISITNVSDHDVSFELVQNGNHLAVTGDQLVQEVRDLADEVPSEPFERKLWRYVADTSYYFDPLTGGVWQHDPVLFTNSIGFGFCDDVAAVYVSLARHAGYDARAWDLNGHVVPELSVNGEWRMYDPALAVYYMDGNGRVADVATLGAHPTLITEPYWLMSADPYVYSSDLAQLYSSGEKRVLWERFFAPPRDVSGLVLPTGARITYPGQWSSAPTGVWGTPILVAAQLRLDLPVGFAGVVDWPLVPWVVEGTGVVRLGGTEFVAGSAELTAFLQDTQAARDPAAGRPVEVIEAAGPLSIVYLLSPVRFSLGMGTDLRLKSVDAWALEVSLAAQQPGEQLLYDSVESVARRR